MKNLYLEPALMIGTLVRWLFLASVVGALAGVAVGLFLRLLFLLNGVMLHLPLWSFALLLPLGGAVSTLIVARFAPDAQGHGTEAVIRAVHAHDGSIPLAVAPVKTIATLISLAVGGSAGKEGPSAQIGATLASAVARALHLSPYDRKYLVICGISAGFAAVFGTPIAGTVFGLEVLTIGGFTYEVLLPSFAAGVTAFEVARRMGVPYLTVHPPQVPILNELLFLKMVVVGVVTGLAGILFVEMLRTVERARHVAMQRYHVPPAAVTALGGLLLLLLSLVAGRAYLGLSLPLLYTALAGGSVAFLAFFWKTLFTAITLGSGFSGGIITPIFVSGAALGAALSGPFHMSAMLGAAVGMMAMTAATANTPISSIIMAMELFGASTGIYALAASIPAFITIGHRSVYPSQLITAAKSSWVRVRKGRSLEDVVDQPLSLDLDLRRRIVLFEQRSGMRMHRRPPH